MLVLNEHKLKYLNRRLTEIDELKKSLLTGNFEVAIAIGHRLKGNGVMFGFPLISAIGISLEQAGLSKDSEKLSDLIEKLALNVEENLKQISHS